MFYTWILAAGILVGVEVYSLGVVFLAKKCGEKSPWKNMIPYFAFKTARRISGPFAVLTIPVKKMAGTMVFVSVAAVLACLWAEWGDSSLPLISSEALWQIMWVVMCICALVAYMTVISCSAKLYRRFNVKNETLYVLLSLFLVTVPFLYIVVSRNQPRTMREMY